jgi:hypothetical protein
MQGVIRFSSFLVSLVWQSCFGHESSFFLEKFYDLLWSANENHSVIEGLCYKVIGVMI